MKKYVFLYPKFLINPLVKGMCLNNGRWQRSEVTAIFKKGDKNKANNYRPVSLTCIICKLLEHLITQQLQKYMEDNKFYSSAQHGFRKHRSCATQLIEVMNTFTELIDNKKILMFSI